MTKSSRLHFNFGGIPPDIKRGAGKYQNKFKIQISNPKTKNVLLFGICALVLFCHLCFGIWDYSFATPCYGTRLPRKREFSAGLESYSIFKRYLENDQGKLRSTQFFLLFSYGVFDWLAIDLKGGAGNIKQHPVSSDEIRYASNFAGGYGLRLRLLNKDDWRLVFGFQHISVHPKSKHVGSVKHQAILDDWQVSFLLSKEIFKFTPYLGTRWSRVDYIHWIAGERKRVMSEFSKSVGLIFGCDFPIMDRAYFNLEGQFFDSEALAFSLNYNF